jgi:hypothetical protein
MMTNMKIMMTGYKIFYPFLVQQVMYVTERRKPPEKTGDYRKIVIQFPGKKEEEAADNK